MERIKVGHISEIAVQGSRIVHVGGTEIALFQLSDGSFKAIENRCPHKNGKLSEGIVCDHHVFCPLHDWKISLEDGLVQAPDEGCVKTFAAETDGVTGDIWLLVDEKASRVS